MNSPPGKYVLIFDGHCAFCVAQSARLQRFARGRVELLSFREPGALERFPHISAERCEREMVLVAADGSAWGGAEAAARVWMLRAPLGWAGYLYYLPVVRELADITYHWISKNRFRLRNQDCSDGTCGLHHSRPRVININDPAREFARKLIIRLLGIIYICAFVSLWTQIPVLIGENGLWPARGFIAMAREEYGGANLLKSPTVFWFGDSNSWLQLAAGAGTLASLSLTLLIAPKICLAVIWILYLSFAGVCGPFLGFQWDNLIIESAFFTFLIAPRGLLPYYKKTPPRAQPVFVFLMIWLLFRLHFESGMAKILWNDEHWNWSHLTAMVSYYETAPLPTWIGWHMHQMPEWFHRVSAAATLIVELFIPFLLFGPVWARRIAAAIFVAFHLSILATGNYGVFNYISIVLCIFAIPRAAAGFKETIRSLWRGWRAQVSFAIAGALIYLTYLSFSNTVMARAESEPRSPTIFTKIHDAVAPFRTFNSYHLFASLTLTRAELEIQGSENGTDWKNYEFYYKPGVVTRAPVFVAPHQPRVDFQLWFLARVRRVPETQKWQVSMNPRNGYINNLVDRIATVPRVTAPLFETNPFPERGPRFIRLAFYHYRMSTRAERAAAGAYWVREFVAYHPYVHDSQSGVRPRY
ncbi:MAG: lipase maturation factor family protein [Planctomycetota bacterium]